MTKTNIKKKKQKKNNVIIITNRITQIQHKFYKHVKQMEYDQNEH